MRKKPRQPFTLLERSLFRGGTYYAIAPQAPDAGYGMTSDVYDYLVAHARCMHCRRPATSIIEHLDCNPETFKRQPPPVSAQVVLMHPDDEEWNDLWFKERYSRWTYARKVRVETAVGSHTRDELRVLRELQEDCCFYCFASLLGPGGRINGPDEPVTCHADHFVALCDGGNNFISNIVLACPSCNKHKRLMNGYDFYYSQPMPASAADRAGLRRTHKARREHPYRLVPPPDQPWLDFSLL